MTNIFIDYPEFVDQDPRKDRETVGASYTVDANFQFIKHQLSMPAELILGKSVLDLGCCVGATGAWSLHHGATRYVGVDLQKKFCQLASSNLQKRFPGQNWTIKQQSLTDFFKDNTEQFDIVVLFGVLYNSIYFESLLKNTTELEPAVILIDSINPLLNISDSKLANLPLVEYVENQYMLAEDGDRFVVNAAKPNLLAVRLLLQSYGFSLTEDVSVKLQSFFPNLYSTRYCAVFTKTSNAVTVDVETSYADATVRITAPFNKNTKRQSWKFDQEISNFFEEHARQHIPDYDRVIMLSVSVCKKLFTEHNRIIDVGCATGETVKRLYGVGFHNLVGVDASADMLSKVKNLPIAHWIESNHFPVDDGPYSAVICNWTLHFIKDKITYLTDIYRATDSNGILILTDKTANLGIELELYHDFKRAQGVSEEEIVNKAYSVRDIMFIDTPEWYLKTLAKVGFKDIAIINATPCFTTFMAYK
jgi:SAM-dependent methyltransferase